MSVSEDTESVSLYSSQQAINTCTQYRRFERPRNFISMSTAIHVRPSGARHRRLLAAERPLCLAPFTVSVLVRRQAKQNKEMSWKRVRVKRREWEREGVTRRLNREFWGQILVDFPSAVTSYYMSVYIGVNHWRAKTANCSWFGQAEGIRTRKGLAIRVRRQRVGAQRDKARKSYEKRNTQG